MALIRWTIFEALNQAIIRLSALQMDARLTASEQALCGELAQADSLVLNALRADHTIAVGQRNARAQQIEDKVFALGVVETAHRYEISIDAFYNALDLSTDAAEAIRLGLPSFISDISTGP